MEADVASETRAGLPIREKGRARACREVRDGQDADAKLGGPGAQDEPQRKSHPISADTFSNTGLKRKDGAISELSAPLR